MISRKGSPSAPFTAKAITAMASMTRMASAARFAMKAKGAPRACSRLPGHRDRSSLTMGRIQDRCRALSFALDWAHAAWYEPDFGERECGNEIFCGDRCAFHRPHLGTARRRPARTLQASARRHHGQNPAAAYQAMVRR